MEVVECSAIPQDVDIKLVEDIPLKQQYMMQRLGLQDELDKITKDYFQPAVCEVISYDGDKKILDVNFKGYDVRINNVEKRIISDRVVIHYKGAIGTSEFQCTIG